MSRGNRDPYKCYLSNPKYPVPRQTWYNWQHAATADDSNFGAELDDSCVPGFVLCTFPPQTSTYNPELTDSNTSITVLEGDEVKGSNIHKLDFKIESYLAPIPSYTLSPAHLCGSEHISLEVGLNDLSGKA